MPSAAFRFALEAAFLILVALGAGLARLEPVVIVALMAVAWVLVALVERASAREAARAAVERTVEEPPARAEREHVEVVQVPSATPEAREPDAEPEPEPEPAPAPEPEPEPEPDPEPQPVPEPDPAYTGPPREWNIWDLQRRLRDRADDPGHEEQAALVLSLRDFARPDGTLPQEFDDLVRESFGNLLLEDDVRSEAATAP